MFVQVVQDVLTVGGSFIIGVALYRIFVLTQRLMRLNRTQLLDFVREATQAVYEEWAKARDAEYEDEDDEDDDTFPTVATGHHSAGGLVHLHVVEDISPKGGRES